MTSPATVNPVHEKPLIQWAQRALISIALVLMVFHGIVFLVYGVSLAVFPFDYDQGEGFELNDTVLFSQGQWPYRDNEVYPFYASNYPPLFHLVLVPFAWLFGPAYWYGRLAGMAATLIAAGAIGFAVHRETRSRPASILAGLAFVASNYVYHIGPLFRQHISMVMFETLAVVVLARLSSQTDARRQRRILILTLLLLLAAGYTKQLAVATVAGVFIWLALRGVRRSIVWGVILAAIAGGLFLLINISTANQWWINTITANVNQYIIGQYTGLLTQFLSLHGAVLILAVLMVICELYFDRLSVYSVWFVAGMVNSVLAGKWGAGDSYFATAIAGACLLAGIFTGRSLQRSWRFPTDLRIARSISQIRLNPSIPALALFVIYGLAVVKMPLDGAFAPLANVLGLRSNTKFANFYDSAGWTMGYATIGQIPTRADIDNGWKIVNLVKDDPRPILSEEAAFSFHARKPVVSNPTQLLNLYDNKHYNPDSLVAMIDKREFGAVIFRARFYPPPVLDAVDRNYKVKAVIPMNGYEYTVLIPKD